MDFISYLKERVISQLPGFDSHIKMVPKVEGKEFRSFTPKSGSKKNAVMIILTEASNDDYNIWLTLRSMNLKSHRGQISFPGGRMEPGENTLECAIRETHEEIGVLVDSQDIIGKLSDLYVEPSDSIITPYVAFIKNELDFIPNPDEVEDIFPVSLNFVSDYTNLLWEDSNYKGDAVQIPYFNINKPTKLWGATAMILAELCSLFEEYKL